MTIEEIENIHPPMQRLLTIVRALREPDGCPWDREQTHQSLAICLVEECAEVLETIDKHDREHMREELGDLLLQVVLHARIAEEEQAFDFDAVVTELNEKLVRRHPHVFGNRQKEASSMDALKRWEEIKAQEKASKGITEKKIFSDLPPALPATLFALKTYKKIQKHELYEQCDIDRAALQAEAQNYDEDMLGKELFRLICLAREQGIDPESALRKETRKHMLAGEPT